ncbi:putative strigolactone esterase D14 [Panicum miliaceum]|uniref:Strigolactone esterase D14 n=1 Tax=Panicum miliaceum TaxID=4540 RepID=A0A3L6TSG6_PANMI|nr:putative strigolactone esterase D14 [Panicum miliaceum]
MLRSTHPPSPTSGSGSGSSAAPASTSDAKMVGGGGGAAGSGAPSGAKLLQILNVRVVGSGERVVVLSHGFGTDQSAWSRVLPYLTRDHRVVLYDLVCAGSVNPEHFDFRRYDTLDSYVDDLLAILDALRIPRCAFVGHSVSAMIGILASIRRPELFAKLILIGASPRFLNDNEYHGGFELPEIQQVFDAMAANYSAWATGYAPLAVGADVPAAVQEFSRTLFNMRPDISLHVCRTVFNTDLRGVLGMVRAPCVVVQTTRDVSVPASVAAYLKAHLGGRTTVEFLQTEGHLPHLSAPGLLAQVLRRALARY